MKKFKSLSVVFAGALLLTAAWPLRPAMAECRGTNLATKTMVAVSTTITSPTTLIAAGSLGACQEVKILLHWSGSGTKPNSEFLLLSDTTSFSNSASTGTFRIPAGNLPDEFFNLGEYAGPLFAVVIGTTGAGTSLPNVSLIKKK